MKKKKEIAKELNPLPKGVNPSSFRKSNIINFANGFEAHSQVSGNSPQFRINQHKGA